ncbi:GTPase HflX, partial [Staphylococcus felis]
MKKELHTTKEQRERAVLVGVDLLQSDYDFTSTMSELESLAQTCRLEVLGVFQQNKNQFDQKYYVGKGKLQEIKDFVDFNEIDVLIANDE